MPSLRIKLETGLLSESGTCFYSVVRYVDAPVSWPEMDADAREEFANEHLAKLEEDMTFSDWEEVSE